MIRKGKGNKDRLTFMDTHTQQILARYLVQARPAIAKKALQAFIVHDRGRRMKRHEVRKIVKAYSAKARIRKAITCHSLRRTFGTLMLAVGHMDLKTLSEIMGHEKIETTAGYTQLSIAELTNIYRQAHPRSQT